MSEYYTISYYCKKGYFSGHVIFAFFAVDIQSAKINDRGSKELEQSTESVQHSARVLTKYVQC